MQFAPSSKASKGSATCRAGASERALRGRPRFCLAARGVWGGGGVSSATAGSHAGMRCAVGAGVAAGAGATKTPGAAACFAGKPSSQDAARTCVSTRRGLSFNAPPDRTCTTSTTRLPEAPARREMVSSSRRSDASGPSFLKREKTRSLSSMRVRNRGMARHVDAAGNLGGRSSIRNNARLLRQSAHRNPTAPIKIQALMSGIHAGG